MKAPSSRELICVDLRGLKAALVDRAHAGGVSLSEWIRSTLSKALGASDPGSSLVRQAAPARTDRVRLFLRMSSQDALATAAAARAAGLPLGSFVAGLVSRVPVVQRGIDRSGQVSALIRSCAELSILSRSINRLVDLLRHGSANETLKYREMLEKLNGDVRRHLKLASGALADLRPTAPPPLDLPSPQRRDEHEHT